MPSCVKLDYNFDAMKLLESGRIWGDVLGQDIHLLFNKRKLAILENYILSLTRRLELWKLWKKNVNEVYFQYLHYFSEITCCLTENLVQIFYYTNEETEKYKPNGYLVKI